MADAELLDPATFRSERQVRIDIGDKQIVARKVDMTTMVFDGRVPVTLLASIQNLTAAAKNGSRLDRVKALGEAVNGASNLGAEMLALLRRHAVDVIVQPSFTLTDTGNANEIPVNLLTLQQLMQVWSATTVSTRPNVSGTELSADLTKYNKRMRSRSTRTKKR